MQIHTQEGMMAFHFPRQSGITLLEVTIAVCLAGLLTLAVLAGQGMVERATAKLLAEELGGMKNMVAVYRDRFRAIPGDDARADQHLTGGSPSTLHQGDGRIDADSVGTWTGTAGIDPKFESGLFWQHVRLARLAGGDPAKGHAFNAVRGRLGIGSDGNKPTRPAGTSGLYHACTAMIAGRLARLIDLELDDGEAISGRVWAAIEVSESPVVLPRAPSPYVNGQTYTVCMAM